MEVPTKKVLKFNKRRRKLERRKGKGHRRAPSPKTVQLPDQTEESPLPLTAHPYKENIVIETLTTEQDNTNCYGTVLMTIHVLISLNLNVKVKPVDKGHWGKSRKWPFNIERISM